MSVSTDPDIKLQQTRLQTPFSAFRSWFMRKLNKRCKTAMTNYKSLSPSCKSSIKSEHEVVCLLVKSVSLWQHVCTSLSASVSKVLKSYLPTLISCLNTLFTLISSFTLHLWQKKHFTDLNMSHFTKTLNSNSIGYFFVPVEKVPRLP